MCDGSSDSQTTIKAKKNHLPSKPIWLRDISRIVQCIPIPENNFLNYIAFGYVLINTMLPPTLRGIAIRKGWNKKSKENRIKNMKIAMRAISLNSLIKFLLSLDQSLTVAFCDREKSPSIKRV